MATTCRHRNWLVDDWLRTNPVHEERQGPLRAAVEKTAISSIRRKKDDRTTENHRTNCPTAGDIFPNSAKPTPKTLAGQVDGTHRLTNIFDTSSAVHLRSPPEALTPPKLTSGLSSTLTTTIALDDSSLRQFAISVRTQTARGLPSSDIQHRTYLLSLVCAFMAQGQMDGTRLFVESNHHHNQAFLDHSKKNKKASRYRKKNHRDQTY